jgi:hypothetical protein
VSALRAIIGIITGDLTGALERAYKARLEAQTDAEKLAADERLAQLKARQEVILKAQGDPIERFVRIGFAMPFVIFVWKLVVWDIVLKMGTTDDLSQNLWNVFFIVLGGYFVDTVVRRFR